MNEGASGSCSRMRLLPTLDDSARCDPCLWSSRKALAIFAYGLAAGKRLRSLPTAEIHRKPILEEIQWFAKLSTRLLPAHYKKRYNTSLYSTASAKFARTVGKRRIDKRAETDPRWSRVIDEFKKANRPVLSA